MRDDGAPSDGPAITSLDVVRGESVRNEIPGDGEDARRSAFVVEVAKPSRAQLDAASDRIATLIADLWMRGLLAPDAGDE